MIKVIIGLGNPGAQYYHTRHNIGYRVADALAEQYGASWKTRGDSEECDVRVGEKTIRLIKPLTFMNNSGKVIPELLRKGIKPENMLVIHDELELPLGKIKFKVGGSAHGHNGLKSIIGACGDNFQRIRCGVGRPEQGEDVGAYVLRTFDDPTKAEQLIKDALACVLQTLETDQ